MGVEELNARRYPFCRILNQEMRRMASYTDARRTASEMAERVCLKAATA